jgi:hypothetical protein
MITTLRTGSLTLDIAVQYKFTTADKKLTIRLTSDGNHKLYGDVNIALSNAQIINVTKKDGAYAPDFFNKTFKFSKISNTELEYSEIIVAGIALSEDFQNLPDNGSAVQAQIANSSFDLPAGRHSFFLLDSEDSNFSTSTISIKQMNISGSGVDGIESVFDKLGDGDSLSINNQDLYFSYSTRISIKNDNSGVTNIPLVINS